MQKISNTVVVLGTGGTIAGTAADARDNVGYRAAQLDAAALVAAVPALAAWPIDVEQVAQIDSKDMDVAVWQALALRVAHHLGRPEVTGIVITHGTDTLEETAYLLQRLFAPARPIVLTAAMRPATALLSDGPQNLLDAVRVAADPAARGVVAVLAGQVHSALDVRKTHPYRLDAFDSGDAGALAQIEEGVLRGHRAWPQGAAIGVDVLPPNGAEWPRVAIVTSHAGADAVLVQALCSSGVDGIVVAGTGNGSVHRSLEAALCEAQAAGVPVLRTTRCPAGSVIDAPGAASLPSAGALTPVQARIELLLRLLQARRG